MSVAEYKPVLNRRTSAVDEWLDAQSEEEQMYIAGIVKQGNLADFWRWLDNRGEAPCSLSRFRERLREIHRKVDA